VYQRLNEINATLQRGNLSEDEYTEITRTAKALHDAVFELNALQDTDFAGRIAELQKSQYQLDESVKKAGGIISALQQYTAKRTEIALSVLKMSSVTIRLYEIVRSTGELKPCFKFLYDGREYPTLSLSEKIKAGIEIAYMLRNLTGNNFPIFIDNSESIGDFNSNLLPEQSLLMRFVKGAEFSVKTKKIPKIQELPIQKSEEAA
jgi:hypothetical protein